MNKMLSSLFAEAKAPKVDWEGEPLYGVYEVSPVPECIVVEFLNATAIPVQGLTLKAYGGILVVNEVEGQEILLWHDTAPRSVSVRVKGERGKKLTLKIWNIWRGTMGKGVEVTQAWLGNAGMRVEQSADGEKILLRCSDGEGPIDFSDLEVRLNIS